MIKTILVPASGSSTDDPVFATALAAARPLAAHLEFYHVRLSTGEAAVRAPHVDFCIGSALPAALHVLQDDESKLSESAAAHVQSFCRKHSLRICQAPDGSDVVSASFMEERDRARDRLLRHARHSDLIVLGRSSHLDYLPPLLMEDILLGSGRPILIAPGTVPKTLIGTVVVGWKETPESARALGAAWPLLEKADEVILLNVVESESDTPEPLEHLAQQLKWHDISAEIHVIAHGPRRLTNQLARVAADLHADLLVVGGFGHGRLREWTFGGVTQSLLEHADLPVFMMH